MVPNIVSSPGPLSFVDHSETCNLHWTARAKKHHRFLFHIGLLSAEVIFSVLWIRPLRQNVVKLFSEDNQLMIVSN